MFSSEGAPDARKELYRPNIVSTNERSRLGRVRTISRSQGLPDGFGSLKAACAVQASIRVDELGDIKVELEILFA